MLRASLDSPRFVFAFVGAVFALAFLAAPGRPPAPQAIQVEAIAFPQLADSVDPADPVAGELAESPAAAAEEADAAARVERELETLPSAEAALALDVLPKGEEMTRVTITAQRGDTLGRLLTEAGVSRNQAQAVMDSLKGLFNPRDLKPGHEIQLSFMPEDDAGQADRSLGRLHAVRLAATIDREVTVDAAPDGSFTAQAITKQVNRLLTRTDGEIIGGSLMVAGMQAGVPASVVAEMIRILSFDVDFQRDIQPGDRFDLLYERFQLADGRLVRGGEVQYAAVTIGGKLLRLYRYKDARGMVDYYNELGHSVRKALLKTPIDGAKLSSRFGMREHPILGFTVMHRGVDFAAPTGTPIYAAGEGVIEDIGDRNGYGRYIRIKHTNAYATAYAHMNGFARGLRQGTRVRQGQIVGYVGTTGRSTGPHLHYEVLRQGQQINPVQVKFPSGEKLAGAELARFRALKIAIDDALSSGPAKERADIEPIDQLAARTLR